MVVFMNKAVDVFTAQLFLETPPQLNYFAHSFIQCNVSKNTHKSTFVWKTKQNSIDSSTERRVYLVYVSIIMLTCHGVDGYHSCPEFDLLYSQCKTSQIICLMCWDLPAAFMTIWTTERCSSRPDWQWIQWQVCDCQTGFLLIYWLRNPGLFQEFPWPKWFSTTFQVLEFSRKKSMTFQHLPGGVGTLVTHHSQ